MKKLITILFIILTFTESRANNIVEYNFSLEEIEGKGLVTLNFPIKFTKDLVKIKSKTNCNSLTFVKKNTSEDLLEYKIDFPYKSCNESFIIQGKKINIYIKIYKKNLFMENLEPTYGSNTLGEGRDSDFAFENYYANKQMKFISVGDIIPKNLGKFYIYPRKTEANFEKDKPYSFNQLIDISSLKNKLLYKYNTIVFICSKGVTLYFKPFINFSINGKVFTSNLGYGYCSSK